MKTKTFLLFCLFMGIGLVQLSAQTGNGDAKKSYSAYGGWEDYFDVTCNGEIIDHVFITVKQHYIAHAEFTWVNGQNFGEAESLDTGEKFKYQEIDKWDGLTDSSLVHFVMIGDEGSRYIGEFIVESVVGGPYVITWVSCSTPGNK